MAQVEKERTYSAMGVQIHVGKIARIFTRRASERGSANIGGRLPSSGE